jgi:hypothetical protein
MPHPSKNMPHEAEQSLTEQTTIWEKKFLRPKNAASGRIKHHTGKILSDQFFIRQKNDASGKKIPDASFVCRIQRYIVSMVGGPSFFLPVRPL